MMVRPSIKVRLLTTQAREDKEKTPKCLDASLEQLDCSKGEKGISHQYLLLGRGEMLQPLIGEKVIRDSKAASQKSNHSKQTEDSKPRLPKCTDHDVIP